MSKIIYEAIVCDLCDFAIEQSKAFRVLVGRNASVHFVEICPDCVERIKLVCK